MHLSGYLNVETMDKLVGDLENAIWSKSGGLSEPSGSLYDKDATQTSAAGQRPSTAVLGHTVCYIVSAVVLKEGRILMMREAKKSCRGTWYLPAGRVEKNESLVEGVVREVLEETGLAFQPISIVCVDSQGTSWFRFTFVGLITGGKLKSLKEEDKESMEAGWFTTQEVFTSLQLRARDICPLINAGQKWYETKEDNPICRLMPAKKSHSCIIVRLLVVKRLESDDNKSLCCLLLHKTATGNNSNPFFPHKVANFCMYGSSVSGVIEELIRDFDSHIQYRTHGYVNVEHSGKPHGVADGLCLTFLIEVFQPVEKGILKGKYSWFELEEKALVDKIWNLIDVKGCVELAEF